jgi:hypothetical protein
MSPSTPPPMPMYISESPLSHALARLLYSWVSPPLWSGSVHLGLADLSLRQSEPYFDL